MAVFFELTTDVFKERFDRAADGPRAGRAGASSVRRPLRGLEVKEDTYAMLKVVDLLGREIRLYDSGSSYGTNTYYTNFILQQVSEPRTEKHQVIETFGEPYIFFYGEQARFIECTAVLLNSQDFNWQAEFWANYDQYLRGSKCAEMGARCYLFYDDVVAEGYMVQAAAIRDAQNPMAVQLQFRMFLTNYRNISLVGDPRFPIRLGVDVSFEQGTTTQWVQLPEGEVKVVQRGLIHDNWDEWTGAQPAEMPPEDPQEIEDLIAAAVDEAAANAANMDRVDSIMDSGLVDAQQGYGGPTPDTTPKTEDKAEEGFYAKNYKCTDNPTRDPDNPTICSCKTAGGYVVVPCPGQQFGGDSPAPAPSAAEQFVTNPLGYGWAPSGTTPPGNPSKQTFSGANGSSANPDAPITVPFKE